MKSKKIIITAVFLILIFVLLKPYLHSPREYTSREPGIEEIASKQAPPAVTLSWASA